MTANLLLYGSVESSQVRLGGDSGQPGLVTCSCGLWNDCESSSSPASRPTTCSPSRPTSPRCWTVAPAWPGTTFLSWTAPAAARTAESSSAPSRPSPSAGSGSRTPRRSSRSPAGSATCAAGDGGPRHRRAQPRWAGQPRRRVASPCPRPTLTTRHPRNHPRMKLITRKNPGALLARVRMPWQAITAIQPVTSCTSVSHRSVRLPSRIGHHSTLSASQGHEPQESHTNITSGKLDQRRDKWPSSQVGKEKILLGRDGNSRLGIGVFATRGSERAGG